jgi:hypothetical protein
MPLGGGRRLRARHIGGDPGAGGCDFVATEARHAVPCALRGRPNPQEPIGPSWSAALVVGLRGARTYSRRRVLAALSGIVGLLSLWVPRRRAAGRFTFQFNPYLAP